MRQAPGGDIGLSGNTGNKTVTPAQTTDYSLRIVPQAGAEVISPAQRVTVMAPPVSDVHPAIKRLRALPRSVALSGMHLINWIEDGRSGFDLGCRFFTMLDNMSGARELYDRGASVVARHWYGSATVSPEYYVEKLGIDNSRHMFAVFQNECDSAPCYGDATQLRERFERDKRFCELLWANFPAVCPAILGASVGTPQIDNADFARVFRETYASFANANAQRLVINWHPYMWRRVTEEWLPTTEAVYPDQKWWAGRPKEFGYNASYGGLNPNVTSIADEIWREAGHGGSKWAGDTDQTATLVWNYWWNLYGSFVPFAGGTCFIGNRSGAWDGYDTRYLWPNVFRLRWQSGAVEFSPKMTDVVIDAYNLNVHIHDERDALGRAMRELYETRRVTTTNSDST